MGQRGSHAPDGWLTRLHNWGLSRGSKHAFALEVGGQRQRMHVQGMARVRCPPSDEGKRLMATDIREFVPIPVGSNALVNVQPFGRGQEENYMLGYVQKDFGLDHYQLRQRGFTTAELDAGRVAYRSIRADYAQGKIQITKAKLWQLAYVFWLQNFTPFHLPIEAIVWYMLQSGRYIISGTWTTTAQGRPLDRLTARSMWHSVLQPEHTSADEVNQILWGEPMERSFLMYPSADDRHRAFLLLQQPEGGHWPKRWWAFFAYDEMRHLVTTVKQEWDNSNAQSDLRDSPVAMKRLREVGRQFLLRYGSTDVKTVVRNHGVFLGFEDLVVNNVVMEDEDMHHVIFPERDRTFPTGFALLGGRPQIFPNEAADDDDEDYGDE